MYGFQLWANLPASQKMMAPRYRDIKSNQIPEMTLQNGTKIRIIAGTFGNQKGPVEDIVINPQYLDVSVPAKSEFTLAVKQGHTVFAYVIEGQGFFCKEKNPFSYEIEGRNYFDIQRDPFVENETLVLFEDGHEIAVSTEEKPVRFLLVSGKPIAEQVAWYGPIVMNTQEELRLAFEEFKNGTFIKGK